MKRRLRFFVGCWILLLAIYLILAGKLEIAEIAAGSFAAALAAWAATAVREKSGIRYAARWAWLQKMTPLPAKIVTDSLLVFSAILRRPWRTRGRGGWREIDFEPGENRAPDRTRRALVTTAVSLPPNSFILQIDQATRRLLVHELVPESAAEIRAKDREWPL